jgi:hypothetical protein
MDFSHSDKVEALRAQVQAFLHDRILPANRDWMVSARVRAVSDRDRGAAQS